MSDSVDSELAFSGEKTHVDTKSTPPHSTPLQRELAARRRRIGSGRHDNSQIKVLLLDGDLMARDERTHVDIGGWISHGDRCHRLLCNHH
jgi:hypothetical protein